jgi:hypothetical protein
VLDADDVMSDVRSAEAAITDRRDLRRGIAPVADIASDGDP